MSFIEVVEVSIAEPDYDRLWGSSIDLPRRGYRLEGRHVEIAGWVLGKSSPAVGVELVIGGEVVRRSRLNANRPDLAAGFSQVADADHGGFRVELVMPREASAEVEVRSVLRDGTRHRIGGLALRRTWRASADPALRQLVSVVIPCFNQAHFLPSAIESVLGQTYPDVEVVVVDDGSTDNTGAVVRRHPSARYVRQENRGLAEARNTGIRESLGDQIVFLDADDLLSPDALALGRTALEEHPEAAFVFGYSSFLMDDGSETPPPFAPVLEGDPYRALLASCPIISPAAAMFRRAAFGAVGVFDPTKTPSEDYDLYCRIARVYPIHGHGAVVSSYRQHGSSMSTNHARMLRGTLGVVRSQRGTIWRRPDLWTAYRRGVRFFRRHYGEAIAADVQRHIQARRWRQAARGFLTLVVARPPLAAALVRSRGRHVAASSEETDR